MPLTLQKTNRTPSILSSFTRACAAAREEIKQRIAQDAQSRAPVESGELRDGIAVTQEGVESTAPYSLFIEIGTERTSPQPFLTPAVEGAESDLVNALREALK